MISFKFTIFTLAAIVAATTMAAPVNTPSNLPGVPMDDAPVYDPEGDDTAYIMSVTETDFFGSTQCDGYKMTIRNDKDGNTMWFRDLVPGFNGDGVNIPYGWVKGETDGNEIVVKAGQMIYNQPENNQVLYIEAVTVDEFGNVSNFLNEFRFTVTDSYITQSDPNVYLAVYEDGETKEEAGFFIFMNNYEIQPVGDIPTFSPPVGIKAEQWVMTWNGGARFVNVAKDGNDIYISGLSEIAPKDYVPGIIENGILTINSGYILTSGQQYYVCVMGGEEGEPDEWGWPSISMTLKMTFSVNDDCSEFTLIPENGCIVETNYFKTAYFNAISGVKITKYEGDKPATPASPEILDYDALNNTLMFHVPTTDIDGNFINADHLSYCLYFDDAPYTFTPENYEALNESMTYIPYNFTDSWDIYNNGTYHTIFLHNPPQWNVVKVASEYSVDGVSNHSPNTPLSKINALQEPDKGEVVSEKYTDLHGRIVTNPQPGSIIVVTTTYSSGETTVKKHFSK